jgi:F0F1-type ATP synthase assembly protein I
MKIRPQVKPASKGADEGWAVLSTLISGFVVFGGIGWLLDRWWDTHLMVPIGLIVGMALSIYAVVMQFGRPDAVSNEAVGNEAVGNQAVGNQAVGNQAVGNQAVGKDAATARQSVSAATALRTEKALNRARAFDRARAAAQAPPAHPPNDGPPPASTRRETECL